MNPDDLDQMIWQQPNTTNSNKNNSRKIASKTSGILPITPEVLIPRFVTFSGDFFVAKKPQSDTAA